MVAGRYDGTPPLIPVLAAVGSRGGVLPLGRGGWLVQVFIVEGRMHCIAWEMEDLRLMRGGGR